MKKTGQLIFVSKEGEEIVEKIGVSYIYYLEILSDRRCVFNIEGEIIEASANKILYIRTPVKSIITLTGGANIDILYETGDSTSFEDRALKQFIGSGSLPTESQTIVGAINEMYSTPGLGSSNSEGDGFRYPNEKTLLKINESSLNKWNGYEISISNSNRAIGDLQNANAKMQKDIANIQLLENQNRASISTMENTISDTNQSLATSNQVIISMQEFIEQTSNAVDVNSKSISLIQTELSRQSDEIERLLQENLLIKEDIQNNSKDILDKVSFSQLEDKIKNLEEIISKNGNIQELEDRIKNLEQINSVIDGNQSI